MRLIDADAITTKTFVDFVGNQGYISFGDALWMISELPTVEAKPVVHGEWSPAKYTTNCSCGKSYETIYCSCSVCNHVAQPQPYGLNFCPNCGARMVKKHD